MVRERMKWSSIFFNKTNGKTSPLPKVNLNPNQEVVTRQLYTKEACLYLEEKMMITTN